MSKGVTPVVATVLLITVTFAAAGTIYTLVNENINRAEDTQTDIGLNIGGLSAETCYIEDNNTRVVLRNGLTESINASKMNIITDGRLRNEEEYTVSDSIVDPQSTFEVEIDSFLGGGNQIEMTDGDQEFTHNCISLGDTQLYETSFETSGEDWEPFTTNKTITNASTSATDSVSIGGEALKAGRRNGVGGHNYPPGGHGGMAKNFSTDYDILELDFRAISDEWGRNTIMIKNTSESDYEVLWINNSQCATASDQCGYDTGWQTRTFNISKYPADFTLIIGNNDDSENAIEGVVHDREDHGWTIWADDIELAQLN